MRKEEAERYKDQIWFEACKHKDCEIQGLEKRLSDERMHCVNCAHQFRGVIGAAKEVSEYLAESGILVEHDELKQKVEQLSSWIAVARV